MKSQALTRRSLVAGLGASVLSGPRAHRATSQATPAATPDSGGKIDGLIDADQLAAILDRGGVRLVAFTSAEEYDQAHIPGANTTDYQPFELTDSASPDAVDAWANRAREIVASFGIHDDSRVAVYDGRTLFAARFKWVLAFLGITNVRVLDGGLSAWQAIDQRVESGSELPLTARSIVREVNPAPGDDVLARLPDVEAAIGDPGTVFVDTRAPDEYEAGHLPGAINVPYTENAVDEPIPLWKPATVLNDLYTDAGITAGMRVIPYCSTGVRSAVTWFTLLGLGYRDLALFSGSWAEWSADSNRPVVTGPQP